MEKSSLIFYYRYAFINMHFPHFNGNLIYFHLNSNKEIILKSLTFLNYLRRVLAIENTIFTKFRGFPNSNGKDV